MDDILGLSVDRAPQCPPTGLTFPPGDPGSGASVKGTFGRERHSQLLRWLSDTVISYARDMMAKWLLCGTGVRLGLRVTVPVTLRPSVVWRRWTLPRPAVRSRRRTWSRMESDSRLR